MTSISERVIDYRALRALAEECAGIAEYACFDKFEERFRSDPKKHPASRAAVAILSLLDRIEALRKAAQRLLDSPDKGTDEIACAEAQLRALLTASPSVNQSTQGKEDSR